MQSIDWTGVGRKLFLLADSISQAPWSFVLLDLYVQRCYIITITGKHVADLETPALLPHSEKDICVAAPI